MAPAAKSLVYSWNPDHTHCLKNVRIEDDIRDALQSIQLKQPSLTERFSLLELSAQVGVQHAFLGFPAASEPEYERCEYLALQTAKQNLPIEIIYMSRAVESDIESILKIRDSAGINVVADIFIGISRLRRLVEGWKVSDVMSKLHKTCLLARREGLPFRVSLEDSSRADPTILKQALLSSAKFGAKAIILCDTVGECTPEGAILLTKFSLDILKHSFETVEIGWHGHNDKGLSLANAWASAQAGAKIISGTFLGVGERTGNTPLEQLIWLLYEAGHTHYDIPATVNLCQTFAKFANVNVAGNTPLIGSDIFTTATGTHVAAIIKSKIFGADYEDMIFSSVPATALGRHQKLLLGPHSGRAAIKNAILSRGHEATTAEIDALTAHCKSANSCLTMPDKLF